MLLAAVFVFTILVPTGAWIIFLRWEDRSEPEPGRLMRRCLYAGFFAAIAAGVFEAIFFNLLNLPDIASLANTAPLALVGFTALLIGPIEELWKYLALRMSVYKTHDFNQVFDGVVYGITIALGFSFIENILYLFQLHASLSTVEFITVMVFRGLFSTTGHVVATGVVGYHLGKAKFSDKNKIPIIIQGLILGSLLHSTFDFLDAIPYGIFLGAFLNIYYFIVFVKLWNDPSVRTVWRYIPASEEKA